MKHTLASLLLLALLSPSCGGSGPSSVGSGDSSSTPGGPGSPSSGSPSSGGAKDNDGDTSTLTDRAILLVSDRKLDGSDSPNDNNTTNIWIMNADGTGLKPLTTTTAEGADSDSPRWSPDGRKIVFVSSRAPDGANASNPAKNIWTMNGDGTDPVALTTTTTEGDENKSPQWSPDGMKILFTSAINKDAGHHKTSAIWVMMADGTDQAPLTKITAEGVRHFLPQWSPDGQKIVFASNLSRKPDGTDYGTVDHTIWIIDFDGNGMKRLTADSSSPSATRDASPQWSPDGKRIVFNSNRAPTDMNSLGEAQNIWSMNADGTDAIALTAATTKGILAQGPQWSPDGKKIVFDSTRDPEGTDAVNPVQNIWVVNADGTDLKALTKSTVKGIIHDEPRWFSGGKRIVFSSLVNLDGSDAAGDVLNIWTVNADGTALTSVTKTENAHNKSPY